MWKKVRRPQEEKSRYIKRLKKCWIYKENQDMKKLVSTDFSAENWLILGKKWSMMIATADKYGCRTLPMRNWHPYSQSSSSVSSVGHYLWGIDTWREPVPFLTDLTSAEKVGHYLWGIDTILSFIFSSFPDLHVGHYLWGIDTFILNPNLLT